MAKTINIRSEEFKQNLCALINNSNLPIANVYYIFQAVAQELEMTYYGTLNEESEIKTETIGDKAQEVDKTQMPDEITNKEDA